jgi:hypothetical protein
MKTPSLIVRMQSLELIKRCQQPDRQAMEDISPINLIYQGVINLP